MRRVQDETSFVAAHLLQEFEGRIEAGIIRRVAKQEVALFEGSKVHDFISVIALRLARARLEEYLHDPKRTDLGTRAGDVEIAAQQTSVEAAI